MFEHRERSRLGRTRHYTKRGARSTWPLSWTDRVGGIVKIDMLAPVTVAEDEDQIVDHTVFSRCGTAGEKNTAAKAAASHLKDSWRDVASFGKSFLHKGDAEYALHAKLNSKDALQSYADHPLHRRWVERFVTKHCVSKQALDVCSPARRARL